ncbi:MAG: amidohydrolase [Chloroflexota bacterium]|nr:amidohydrolase [Chloroflexota bacterium]
MAVIDADTHVHENDDTWAYLDESERRYRPEKGETTGHDDGSPIGYWLVDGVSRIRAIRKDNQTYTTAGTRELTDVDARVRFMDQMGVDVQVIYPTLFLSTGFGRSEVELALLRSYNRWMADRCQKSAGRLRWVMLPPLQTMDKAIEELRFAKEHGACGILKKGDPEGGHWPAEPHFFPLYEEAERLGLPICFHVGSGTAEPMPLDRLAYFSFHKIILSTVHAFQTLITFQIPNKFPGLRWGFVEANSSWVPFVLYHMKRILAKNAEHQGVTRFMSGSDYQIPQSALADNNIYVTCQVDEDLPYIIKHAGEDQLMVGSDYTHHDTGEELHFLKRLEERAESGEISHAAVRKITSENPRKFYGL